MKCSSCSYQRTLMDGAAAGCPKCGFGRSAQVMTASGVAMSSKVELEPDLATLAQNGRFKGFWGFFETIGVALIIFPLMQRFGRTYPAELTPVQNIYLTVMTILPFCGMAGMFAMSRLRSKIRQQPELAPRYLTLKKPLGQITASEDPAKDIQQLKWSLKMLGFGALAGLALWLLLKIFNPMP